MNGISKSAELIGALVRKARLAKGLTQEQVAKEMGLHQVSYSGIETGRRRLMATESAIVKRILGLDLNKELNKESRP